MSESALKYHSKKQSHNGEGADEVVIPFAEEGLYGSMPVTPNVLRLIKLNCAVLSLLLFAFPLFFGGTQVYAAMVMQILVFALTGLWILTAPSACRRVVADSISLKVLLTGMGLFFMYGVVQLTIMRFSSSAHPVLGTSSSLASWQDATTTLREIAFFSAVVFITTLTLQAKAHYAASLYRMLMLAALLVALIALGHWFYDNGKLFGVFEPEHVFISERARWPFVNSNHLGHFLLPLFFLSLAVVIVQARSFWEFKEALLSHSTRGWSHILVNKKAQSKMASLTFTLLVPLVALLAILASLSRGSWLGLSLVLLIFVFFFPRSQKLKHPHEHQATVNYRKSRHGRKKRGTISSPTFKRMLKPLTCLAAGLLVYFFLSGRGSDLLEARIEYGLLYSLDDMRWTLFNNSLPMLKDHLLLGVGLGQWRHLFPSYMDPMLAGINPVYLHSDPLQLLVESGLVGFCIFLATYLTLGWLWLKKQGSRRFRDSVITLSLIAGFSGLVLASWFDFPFRIPAITAYGAILLALTSFCYERGFGTNN
ncbi:MAG: O-antigen ligase family protein [Deltaproteobacteria bacterium]|nr:O-antigen ligase family protein [Deltaproteobacteria bacterium]